MLIKYLVLSYLLVFLTGCSSKEVVYIDVPIIVAPSDALLEPEVVPVIKGDTVESLVNWSLDLKDALLRSNGKLESINRWKEELKEPLQ
jgi:hypothetical protein